MARTWSSLAWRGLAGAARIDAPLAHRLANLLIALRYPRNTRLYVRSTGRAPNYISPSHYTEKMQCRKLFDRNPLFVVFCDKLQARVYAEQAECGLKFPEIYWSGTSPTELPFQDLEPPYVIKANHRSGALYVVRDRTDVEKEKIEALCRRWLRSPYAQSLAEWGYRNVPRRIYAEELLPAPQGLPFPDDYKFTTISGRVVWIEHIHDRGRGHFKTYFDRSWRRMPVKRWRGDAKSVRSSLSTAPPPKNLDRMIEVSEKLGRDFDQLRLDLYEVGSDIYLGEFTVYEESGLSVHHPEDEPIVDYPSSTMDREIGALWRLPTVSVAEKLAIALLGAKKGPAALDRVGHGG